MRHQVAVIGLGKVRKLCAILLATRLSLSSIYDFLASSPKGSNDARTGRQRTPSCVL